MAIAERERTGGLAQKRVAYLTYHGTLNLSPHERSVFMFFNFPGSRSTPTSVLRPMLLATFVTWLRLALSMPLFAFERQGCEVRCGDSTAQGQRGVLD